MRKVIILLLLVILAIFGYAYKLHTSQINLNVSLSPHCNYSNGSEALRIFLEGARYLYKVEEAPLNIVSPHNYLKKFSGKANETEFGLYTYYSSDSCEKEKNRITNELEQRGFSIYKNNIWVKDKKGYYVNCKFMGDAYILVVARGGREDVTNFAEAVTPLYYGPSPEKVIFYTLLEKNISTMLEEDIQVKEENWTAGVGVKIGGYMAKLEGSVKPNLNVAIYVYPKGCGREVYLEIIKALAKSWKDITPVNATGKMFKKDNTRFYVEYSQVMGFDRVVILLYNSPS
ncbi:hypothetical protein [Pyrococcus horikoshii]|uniref:Uncharacterized protein n=2 Tax=Pyrococcus horikoshii TaxID=53953 RepID=O58424_PYRHO|nr:hypothetical protein [Pyrococcus horikoshii]BAA29783.1 286aa long hypothetical protein [Pyrococcus horikoshii OT3]HII61350.1 hypothetical protein [Pyrococcus horikoshii]